MKAKVSPPRLGGARVGLFSTRSPHRPANIGLSLARLDSVEGDTVRRLPTAGSNTLSTAVFTSVDYLLQCLLQYLLQVHLAGVDMVTGTPVLDIKPYIPQYDSPQPQHTSAQVRLWWTLVVVLNPFALIAHIVYVMTIIL